MKKILLWLWQLPQNLIGLIYSRFAKDKIYWCGVTVYFAPCFKAGVSLGQYIILDNIYYDDKIIPANLCCVIKHEKGHTIQSKCLGWFYLLVVGLPSLCRNIMNRINPKKFNEKWYYSGYPENWANRLGGVEERKEEVE